MPEPITIYATGKPYPQGSKDAHVIHAKGQRPRAVLVDKHSDELKAWRTEVATQARNVMVGAEPLTGPVCFSAAFYIKRPKAHYRTGRFAALLRDDAPLYCATKPDVDKLVRAILDALTGVVYADDSQVVALGDTTKLYANTVEGVRIKVMPL